MTTSAGVPRLVFDTTCLSHFARADRLDVLGDLLAGGESFVPQVVGEVIREGVAQHPELGRALEVEWLRLVATGMRLPCTGADFPRYAGAAGLL